MATQPGAANSNDGPCPAETLIAALDASPQGAVLLDRNRLVRHANPAAYRITGLDPALMSNKGGDFLFSGFTAKSELTDLWSQLEAGRRVEVEWLLQRLAGGFYWCAVTATPIPEGSPSADSFVIYLEDISDRKAAESQLMASEARHRALIDAACMAVLLVGRDGEIQHLNREAERLLGYGRADLRGHDFVNLLVPERARSRTRGVLDALLDGNELRNMEGATLTRDGRELLLLWNAAPLRAPDGRITGIVVTGQNITERKHAEAQLLIAKDEAERTSAAKSEFLAAMSHELRTPLNAIIGNADLVMNQVLGDVDDDYVDCARDIHESGRHLLTVITDILDMAKIEAGKMTVQDDVCDIADIFETVQRIMSEQARSKGVNLTVAVEDPAPLISADAPKMRQIMINLASNAVKFTPKGGSVTLAAETDASNSVHLSVTDTGIGISAEDIPRALEKFVQVSTDGTLKPPGTGLGLPLVQSLCELHGAELVLDSTVGKGTCASFTLPAERTLERD